MVNRGPKKENPNIKKQQRIARLKRKEAKNAEKDNPDTLLGYSVANTAIGIEKRKKKGKKIKLA